MAHGLRKDFTWAEVGFWRKTKSSQPFLTLWTLWTLACPASLSKGLSRQEHWSGLPLPSLGDLPDPGAESTSLTSPELTGGLFTTSATWHAWGLLHDSNQGSVSFSLSVSHIHTVSRESLWALSVTLTLETEQQSFEQGSPLGDEEQYVTDCLLQSVPVTSYFISSWSRIWPSPLDIRTKPCSCELWIMTFQTAHSDLRT